MRAWQKLGPGGDLEVSTIDEPTPGPGEFVLEVHAVGLCHTDVIIVDGPGEQWLTKMPITLGHEVAGVVSALGAPSDDIRIGDRVALLSLDFGNCPGISRDGGYAAKTIGRLDSFVPIPDGLDFASAAVGTDAGMTAHHAVRAAAVASGARVGIIGLGGLGAIGAQLAQHLGADVYAAEIRDEVRQHSARYGVTTCFPDATGFAGLDLDVIIDFAGVGTTTAIAVSTVKAAGTVVVVGLGSLESTISTNALVTKAITLTGSLGGTREDVEGVFAAMADGVVKPQIDPIRFDDIGEGITRLRAGNVRGRFVAQLAD